MTTTEHDATAFEKRHKPTGIRLARPEPVPHTNPAGPWLLQSRPGAGWAAELKITYVRPDLRARGLATTYRGLRDDERFRREFGYHSTLDRAVPVGPSGPVPWDAALVEVFAILFFIVHDTGGFRRGKPAYPDKIELKAPELRGTVVTNKYAQAWS
ncbi:hypothetical protein [Craurococcus roseus]